MIEFFRWVEGFGQDLRYGAVTFCARRASSW